MRRRAPALARDSALRSRAAARTDARDDWAPRTAVSAARPVDRHHRAFALTRHSAIGTRDRSEPRSRAHTRRAQAGPAVSRVPITLGTMSSSIVAAAVVARLAPRACRPRLVAPPPRDAPPPRTTLAPRPRPPPVARLSSRRRRSAAALFARRATLGRCAVSRCATPPRLARSAARRLSPATRASSAITKRRARRSSRRRRRPPTPT